MKPHEDIEGPTMLFTLLNPPLKKQERRVIFDQYLMRRGQHNTPVTHNALADISNNDCLQEHFEKLVFGEQTTSLLR
jgi:hypothetical protein